MRGTDHQHSHIFSYISREQRVRKDHPLRAVRVMVDEILRALSPGFDRMYVDRGRIRQKPEIFQQPARACTLGRQLVQVSVLEGCDCGIVLKIVPQLTFPSIFGRA